MKMISILKNKQKSKSLSLLFKQLTNKTILYSMCLFVGFVVSAEEGSTLKANVPSKLPCSPSTIEESRQLGLPRICINDQLSILSGQPSDKLSSRPNTPGVIINISGTSGAETFTVRALNTNGQIQNFNVPRTQICPTGHLCRGDIVLFDQLNAENKTLSIYQSVVHYTTLSGRVTIQRLFNRTDPGEVMLQNDKIDLSASDVKNYLHRSTVCFLQKFCINNLVNTNSYLKKIDNQSAQVSIQEVFSNGDVTLALNNSSGRKVYSQVTELETISSSWTDDPKKEMQKSLQSLIKSDRYSILGPYYYINKCKAYISSLQNSESYKSFIFYDGHLITIINKCSAIKNPFSLEAFKIVLKMNNDISPQSLVAFENIENIKNSFALDAFKMVSETFTKQNVYIRDFSSEEIKILSLFTSSNQVSCIATARTKALGRTYLEASDIKNCLSKKKTIYSSQEQIPDYYEESN